MTNRIHTSLLASVAIGIALILSELAVRAVSPQSLTGSWKVQTESGLTVNRSDGRVRHQDEERVVHYEFTVPHLRARAPEAGERILVLGDSFTFGWLLDQEDTNVNLLRPSAETLPPKSM